MPLITSEISEILNLVKLLLVFFAILVAVFGIVKEIVLGHSSIQYM